MSVIAEPVTRVRAIGPVAPAPDKGGESRRWIALVFIALAQLMVVLDTTIVSIALPSAQAALRISSADRQWVVTAYTLSFGALLLIGGRVADYAGRKRAFLTGLIGFAAASAVGGAAVDPAMLIGARAVQGAFGALLAPTVLSLLTVTFSEPRDRARAFAVFGAVASGGAALGLILGGVLTEYLSWRWCLYVNAPIAVVVAIGGSAVLPAARSGLPACAPRSRWPGGIRPPRRRHWPSPARRSSPGPDPRWIRGCRSGWRPNCGSLRTASPSRPRSSSAAWPTLTCAGPNDSPGRCWSSGPGWPPRARPGCSTRSAAGRPRRRRSARRCARWR